MHYLSTLNPAYAVSGFIVGVLMGATGVGGGSLMTPLLILLFGIHPTTAVGTDLLYSGITKLNGAAVHGFNRTVDWRVTGNLALGSIPAAIVTLLFTAWLRKHGTSSNHVVTVVLGLALIATSTMMLARKWLFDRVAASSKQLSDRQRFWLTVVLGVVLGALTSFSSVGAGAIGVTFLILLYADMPIAKIVGSDIAHAVPLTLISGAGHWILGSVDWHLLVALLIGSLPGITIGSQIAGRVSDQLLRKIIAIALGAVGIRLTFWA
jgi:uncharacterized protein